MEQYKSTHTGEQIDTAVDKVINNDLPIASASSLGVVKVGENLSISSDGTLSASGGSSGGGTKLYRHYIKLNGTANIVDFPYGTSSASYKATWSFWAITTSNKTINSLSELVDLCDYGKIVSIYGLRNYQSGADEELVYGYMYLSSDYNASSYEIIGAINYKSKNYMQMTGYNITSFTDTVAEL